MKRFLVLLIIVLVVLIGTAETTTAQGSSKKAYVTEETTPSERTVDDWLNCYYSSKPTWMGMVCNGYRLRKGEQIEMQSPQYREASIVAYNWYVWRLYIDQSGFQESKFYNENYAYYCVVTCYKKGRDPWIALTTLYIENGFGTAGGLDFGMGGGYGLPETIDGYCECLNRYQISNNPESQFDWWHSKADPGHQQYIKNCSNIAYFLRGWLPFPQEATNYLLELLKNRPLFTVGFSFYT